MVSLKNIVKKGAGAAILVGGAPLTGAALIAAQVEKKKVEKRTYEIGTWAPLKSDPSKVALRYSPALAFAKSDKLTVSGTPFDGEYSNPEYRTRNEVYIKPSTPVTQSGKGGTFKVKTSVAARAKGMASATKAGVRTSAKKTGKAIKKVTGAASNLIWQKFKWPIIIFIVLVVIYGLSKLAEIYSATRAVTA